MPSATVASRSIKPYSSLAALSAAHALELPMSTQLLISIARFLETNIEFILLFGVILVVVFAFVWTKSLYIQKWCDYHLFAVPFFGRLFRLSAQMAWCRNLAYLLDSGLGALDAIRIAAQSSNHWLSHDLSANLFKQLSQGWDLGEALDRCDPRGQFFDPETKHLLGIGAKQAPSQKCCIAVIRL